MYKTFSWKRSGKNYLIGLLTSLGAGISASILIRSNLAIYPALDLPTSAPPAFIFPVVWTILYILMGVSFGRILNTEGKKGNQIYLYILQLIINFFWPILFFNLRAFNFAFIWLLILIAVVFTMILFFIKLDLWSGLLQIPYFIWLIFASYLNYQVINIPVFKIL